ncbi:hypothetical protein MMC07_008045 [Pseudocyphellaria aurata]|nr:hypothetical protein [Pseudocyphellaria aurata]
MDALRSLIVLDALAPIGTVIVVHHTDCGLTHLSDEGIRKALTEKVPSNAEEIKGMKFGAIKDIDQNLLDDVAIIKASPYLAKDLQVLGYVYEMETGLLREVTSN